MGVWQLLLVGAVILIGLCGVLVPGVPGPWFVWAAVLWWALMDPSTLAWQVLAGSTLALLLSRAVRWQLPRRRPAGGTFTPRMKAYAGGGAVVGFVLLPVIGAVPGFLAGAYVHERLRLGRRAEARAAVRSAMRSGGTALLIELFTCLLIAGAWVGAVAVG